METFNQQQTAEAFPDYQPLNQPEAVPDDFALEDVFTVENESGQSVIDHLVKFSKKCEDAGKEGLLLSMPTVKAYKMELALVRGIAKNSRGELSDESLRILTETYIAAHLRSEDVSDQWTGDDVPLLYLTLRLNGERLDR